MDRDAAIEHCLSRPGAYLDNPWGPDDSVVKVGGKIFVFLGGPDGPLSITVKNTPELIDDSYALIVAALPKSRRP